MSAAITFDTHEFIKELKSVGFSEEQAEVITRLQKIAIQNDREQIKHEYDLENVTNKKDIELLELNIKRDIRELEVKLTHNTELLRAELKRDIETIRKDIAESKDDLRKWTVTVVLGTAILQTSIITMLIMKLLGHI